MRTGKIKILFINPVIRADEKPRHIPYGMAQLVAVARKEGHNLQVLDANALRPNEQELRSILRVDRWDVIATGGLVTTYGYVKHCIQLARKTCPNALIVAGGGVISPIPFEIMTFIPEIDIGVIGEGVITFAEILKRVASGESRDFSGILGIIWRDPKGAMRIARARPLLEDVDSLPFPAYDLFPMDVYFKNSSILLSEEAMSSRRRIDIMASYGCPFRCKYCFHLGLGGEIKTDGSGVTIDFTGRRTIRAHSPEYMIDLLSFAKRRFAVDFALFIDENFIFLNNLTKGKWIDRFFGLWRKSGFVPRCVRSGRTHDPKTCRGIHWGATAHAGLVTPGLLKRMRAMGCSYLDYGFESFSDDILRSIGKGATAGMNERALTWTLKARIRPIPNQIIGFPDETFDSIKKNVSAWKRLGIQSKPFFATPYPGSEWFVKYRDEIIRQYGGDLERFLYDLGDATDLTAVISKRFNAVELLGLRELMVAGDLRRIEEYESLVRKIHTRRSVEQCV